MAKEGTSSSENETPPPSRRPRGSKRRETERVIVAKVTAFQTITLQLIRWVGLGVIFFLLYKMAAVLAGQTTTLNAIINALVDFKAGDIAPWGVAGLTTAGYLKERKNRKNSVSAMSEQIETLERRLDPGRSSSGLTPAGVVPGKTAKDAKSASKPPPKPKRKGAK